MGINTIMTDSSQRDSAPFTIRNASTSDASAIAGFNIAMALETEDHSLDPVTVERGVGAVMENPSLGFYLVAEVAGEVAGCLMVTTEWSDWSNANYWWIQSVFVDTRYRGRGIYRGLYAEVQKRAQGQDKVCAIRLYVEKDNDVAQSVYRKLGMDNSGYLVFESRIEN